MPPRLPILLLLLAACGGADAGTALSTPVIDTLPGGIVRVTNPGPTAWADTNGWRIVLEREIVPEEGSEGEVGNPSGLVADEDGTIYWLMRSPSVIKAYAPDGAWLRNIGREGDGPGEFRDGMFAIVGDKLVLQDPNNTRMTVFETSGRFLASMPSQCCYWTSNLPVFDDGTLGISGAPPTGQSDAGGALYLTRIDGTVTDTVVFPRVPDNPDGYWTLTLTSNGGKNVSRMMMGIPLRPNAVSRYRSDRTVLRGHSASYAFAITGLDGTDTVRVFTASAPTVPVTDAERDSIYEATISGMNEQWREGLRDATSVSDIPTAWPLWGGIAIDPTGHIWVSRPNPAGGIGLLDVFTAEGVLLGTILPPVAGLTGGYWTRDRIYLNGETEEGLPKIAVYRIERTGVE
ncbi:MAG: hypothetical protein U0974_08020 [Gemmatimonadales bacterium]|nr:hypothetical protein [Gemmatimonadales bacterium]MDZ4389661.1 hypothetical protein [Gemmatimonadales bacterium]